MPKQYAALNLGFERNETGKVKLYQGRVGTDVWFEISPENFELFRAAVNEFVQNGPYNNIMEAWVDLDYPLPPTPWDWMKIYDPDEEAK